MLPSSRARPALMYIDLHLVMKSLRRRPSGLRERGLKVRRPDLTIATMDHSTPTTPRGLPILDKSARRRWSRWKRIARDFGIRLYDLKSDQQGIVHVMGPEQGLTQPGMTIVCGDSHTATHGAFGALAFGIGTSQVAHVLATQCLLQTPSKTYAMRVEGTLKPGVTAKDIILAVIAQDRHRRRHRDACSNITGSTIRALSMEERMTICNMSIEGGARAGLVAPDDTTYQYIAGREFAPKGADWDAALARWKQLAHRRRRDVRERADASTPNTLEPMVTFGTNPGMGICDFGAIPDPASMSDPIEKSDLIKALKYMDLEPGQAAQGPSRSTWCSSEAAPTRASPICAPPPVVMKGRKVNPHVRMLVVPGSQQVKKQAEAEGLDKIFRDAGADFREAGCSMCLAMNGDQLQPGEYSVSTSNRNFEGRQGKGGRTFLASPLTAAAALSPA